VFYSGLGFSESLRLPTEGDPIHVDLVLDGYKIGIASVTSTREDRGLGPIPEDQWAAVILWTHDTEQAYTKLTANGVHGLNRRTSGLAG
jgi:glyoxylase I family protein